MRGNVSQGTSGSPKRGEGASLAKKITSNGRVKPSPNTQSSSSSENSQETGSTKQEQDQNKYNKALEKYHNDDKDLAFMKEENFKLETKEQEKTITELNAFMASEGSLASRINATTGRFGTSIGNGRSTLPGDEGGPRTGDNVPDVLPRFALTRSQLYRGIDPNAGTAANPFAGTSYTTRVGSSGSAVSNALNGTGSQNQNTTANFEAYSSAYLKGNAPELSKRFESDPTFKEKYLNNVQKLYNSLDVRTLGKAPVEENRGRLVGQAGLATARDRQQVANAFMTLLANSDSQVDKIAKSGLTVFLADSIVSEGENVAGYFSTDNHMVLSRDPGFATFNATAVHELTHVVDFGDGSLDGQINGLSPNWSGLRSSAEQKIASNGGNLPGIESGFANYANSNSMEFLAVMAQLYQSDSKDLQRNFPGIFSSLDRMFRVA